MDGRLAGWLPIGISFEAANVSVRWIDCKEARFTEPFFPQAIRRLRTTVPPPRERMTHMNDLLDCANGLPKISPSVGVFHVSRCGSTWLSNALGTSARTLVLSEARPIGTLASLSLFGQGKIPHGTVEALRRRLLDAVIRVYAHHHGADKVVIKFHASTVLAISTLRGLWRDVPFVFVIRDPVEVMVSNLSLPSGWLRAKNVPLGKRTLFGWESEQVQQMSDEEYCARGLGAFFEAGSRQRDRLTRVVDYRELGDSVFGEIASSAGLTLPPFESPQYRSVCDVYAKDPARAATFDADGLRKQSEASETVRTAAAMWAQLPYEALRDGRSSWLWGQAKASVH